VARRPERLRLEQRHLAQHVVVRRAAVVPRLPAVAADAAAVAHS
jgi:hypothetical protein